MNDMAGDCYSCASSHFCDLIMNGTTDGCPCKICLLKMMCEKQCDEFKKVYKDIIGFSPASHKGW